jgi:hypothetical protein
MLALPLVACLLSVGLGQEFRVDTELFQTPEKEPFLQTLTIFTDGSAGPIYDFRLTDPPEVTVFDPLRGRFTLLDESRRVKATVMTQDLLDFTLELERQAVKERDPLFSFSAAPQFEITEKAIEQSGQSQVELRLTAKPLTYVAIAQKPQRPEAARVYRHFADWCARLNATRPGNLPPGARLVLNEELAQRELLPLDITRITPPAGPFGKKLELRSEHRVNWSLSGEDQKKIAKAGDMMATFQEIAYNQYCDAPPPLAKQAKK